MSTSGLHSRAAWVGLLGARLAIGLALVFLLAPISVDDAVRVYFAMWWFDHPSFYAQPFWPPGFFYLYGLVCGLARDGLIAPRLLTLALALGTGAVVWLETGSSRTCRWIAAAWLLLSPLTLVLGTVPLAETLFMLAILGGLVALGRFLSTGSPASLAAASALYLAASMVRYEAWPLIPLFTLFACLRRPRDLSLPIAWVLRLLPWAFPALWMALLGLLEADPVIFMHNIELDSYGPGDLAEAFRSPLAWIVGLQALASLAATVPGILAAIRRSARPESLLWETHVVLAALVVAWALASRNVPSQFPIRLLHPLIVLGSVPVARLIERSVPAGRHVHAAALLALVLATSGLCFALTIEPGYDRTGHAAAAKVREAYERSILSPGDHVIVEASPPTSRAVVVYLNRPRTTHVDRTYETSYFSCWTRPAPGWAPHVRMAVIERQEHAAYVESIGWKKWNVVNEFTLYIRPDRAAPLCGCPRAH